MRCLRLSFVLLPSFILSSACEGVATDDDLNGEGGMSGNGGVHSAGQQASGGITSGGTTGGGASSGGGANGGASTAGAALGGSDAGGSGAGGSGAGGSDAGGSGAGGSGSAGVSTGGTTAGAGGSETGGASEGGASGAPFGGADNAGADSGGADNAGAEMGGTESGGADNAGTDSGGADNAGAGVDDGPVELDCDAAMPTSGAQQHSGNGTGGAGNLAWEIWSNTGNGELTSYDVPAFTASWNEAGGYLGRLGYEWGGFMDNPVPYEERGTITAQFVSHKSGTAGQYSYVGMYGWSTDPCVEWYVVDDSYNNMPINPGGTTNMGEVEIDGGTYIMYTRPTTGTGGTRCSGVNDWIQYYSVRRTARACGQISLTKHFDAWKELGMDLGLLLEAKIIVEVGGGTGKVDLPVAEVTATQ